MKTIYYLYPIRNKVSFTFISKQHIRYLREKLQNNVKIIETDVDTFDPSAWGFNRKLILHPLFYPFFEGVSKEANAKISKLNQCLNKGFKIIAFDTADSDRISEKAVDLANKVEAIIVPSNFAKKAFVDSGVYKPVHVVPHGIPDEFMVNGKTITHPDLAKLNEIKKKNNFVFVLFQLVHSGGRKGADLFAKAMSIVQKENPNVIILAKRLEGLDPYLPLLRQLKCVEVSGYLELDAYRQLYDLSDITVLASRGGGFEACSIESLARGVPTIVPEAGCFLDYIKYAIPVKVTKNKPIVLPDNPIHVGKGWEIDVDELAKTILKVADNLNKYKRKAKRNMKKIWKEYSWRRIVDKIIKILIEYDFIKTK